MLIFGVLTVLSACAVVFSRKPLHSALWLVATLVLVAVHFVLLHGEFLAALQIIIYAGAIMVLLIFVIMLLGIEESNEKHFILPLYLSALIVGASSLAVIFIVPSQLSVFVAKGGVGDAAAGTAEEVGLALFREFVYPLQITGLLLLAAVIGAILLSQETMTALLPGRGLRAVREKVAEKGF